MTYSAAAPAGSEQAGRARRRQVPDDEVTVVADAWERLRGAVGPVDLTAAVLIAGQVAAVLALVVPGSFYTDDLRAQAGVFGRTFGEYVRSSDLGDPAALPRIIEWALATWFPFEHAPAVLVTVVIRLMLGVVAWSLLRQLFGARPLALVPLGLLLLSPALLPATAWFSQAISGLLCTTALLWAVDAQLRRLRRARWYHLPQVAAASALAVLTDPKGLAVPLLLLVVTLVLYGSGRRRGFGTNGWLLALRRGSAGLVTSLAAVLVVLAWYDPVPQDNGRNLGIGDTVDLALGAVFRSVLPALFGGPWSWTHPGLYYGLADTSAVLVALVCLVAGAGVARWTVLRPAETGRAALLALGWLLPAFVLVSRQSPGLAPGDPAADLGRWTDVAAALVICGAMAAIPWKVGVCRSDRPVFDETTGEWLVITSLDDEPTGARRPTGLPVLVGLLVAVVAVVLAIGSWSSFGGRWWDNPTDRWLTAMAGSLRQAEPYPRVAPQPLPPLVLPLAWQGALPTDAPLVGLIRPDSRFSDGDGAVRSVSASGELAPVAPVVLAEAKAQGGCVASLDSAGKQALVPLPSPVPPTFGAMIEVGLLVEKATTVEVLGERPDAGGFLPLRWSDDSLPAGAHTVRFPVPPGTTVAGVVVRTPTSPTTCVSAVRIVRMVP
jgi:hypothetical protein